MRTALLRSGTIKKPWKKTTIAPVGGPGSSESGSLCDPGLLSQSALRPSELSARHERGWILPIVRLEFLVKPRVLPPERGWLLEKALRCHGEELGGVGCPVFVEHIRATLLGVPAQLIVFVAEHTSPGHVLAVVFEDRGSVRRAVLLIKLVGELVQHDVVPVVEVRRSLPNIIPGQDHHAVLPRLPEPGRLELQHGSPADRPNALGDIRMGINQDRDQAGIVTLISSVSSSPPQPSKNFSARKTWMCPWSSRWSA